MGIFYLYSASFQGLFEYVKPSWQGSVKPNVADYDVKKFGSSDPKLPSPVSNPDASADMPK